MITWSRLSGYKTLTQLGLGTETQSLHLNTIQPPQCSRIRAMQFSIESIEYLRVIVSTGLPVEVNRLRQSGGQFLRDMGRSVAIFRAERRSASF